MNNENGIVSSLSALYDKFGYSLYKMSKFEEYDLYAKNKDFLISDSVITFTDTNGKLMALKPDVTLSIVKNSADTVGGVQKLYYNENVYRVSKSTKNYKEIMQVGLECIGDVDIYSIAEVLTLAAASIKSISENAVLSISHLGLMTQALEYIGIDADKRRQALLLIGEKNLHGLRELTDEAGFTLLKELLNVKGSAKAAVQKIKELLSCKVDACTLCEFESVVNAVANTRYADAVSIDLSVVDDIHYYNGFVFKGFIEGIPTAVLSGGQYDKLMAKMKRSSKAIGFAVYLDMLEQLNKQSDGYDCDILLLYNDGDDISKLMSAVDTLTQSSSSVSVKKSAENVKYRKLMRFTDGEVKTVG